MKVRIMKKITIIVLIIFLFIPFVHSQSNHGELTESEIIEIAMSAAPLNVSEKATIIGSDGSTLREGNNGWTCMPGTPPNENVNPMCVDKTWQKWLKAYMEQTPYNSENESFGTSYMLIGDQAVDNDDPFNLDKTKGTWIAEGPHLMLLLPESLMGNLPTNPYAGGPYVMWKGNEFVHVMVPLEVTSKP
ncbi:uncharacterized protein METZ01_LOCUS35646 [marine metagenome]|uniref:Uncharacterized protein n=1 Tax=marine metagenome TaxID=408172 RepID=A0A381QTR3_9ZZZZ